MEARVFGIAALSTVSLPLNTSHHLGNQDQVYDQWRCEERVLAHIEQADGLVTVQEDLSVVFVKSSLVVSYCGHVLDDDAVIGMLTVLVQDGISSNHVVNHVGLGDFLGAELLLGTQIHAVIVAEVVVAGDGSELDASIDQEINKSRFHLGLARLEVVTTDECIVFFSKLDCTRNEGVLGRAVDERNTLEDRGNSKNGRGSNFLMAVLNGFQQVVSRVIDTLEYIGITLRVGGPLNNDLIQLIGGFEVTTKTVSRGSK